MTLKRINTAIKKYDLEIIKGAGYHYFLDLKTRDKIGSSVYVMYLKELSIKQWIIEANDARREFNEMYNEYILEVEEEYV
tara:strand:+ start:2920 stop:3159 length:240 start_codon:yes stop_codon:yes gene_type:complete